MIECDITFDSSKKWYTGNGNPDSDENDLLSVATHEFGHCLGLEHSKTPGAVMEEILLKGRIRRDLHEDDIKGRNSIYGQPLSAPKPPLITG